MVFAKKHIFVIFPISAIPVKDKREGGTVGISTITKFILKQQG
jgi:hypothetical protein